MVKVVIGNIWSKIIGFLPDEIHAELDHVMSYKLKNASHMPAVKARKWDGVIHLYQKNKGQSFYTGLLAFARDIFTAHNIEYIKEDQRKRYPQNLPDLRFSPPANFEERDYQDLTVDRAQKFTRGVLDIATGGGKTMIVTKMIGEIKTYPFVFYVMTNDLMRQAHDTLSTCLNEPIGMIGDNVLNIQKINVCTIQTAIRALNVGNSKFKISDYQFDEEDVWDSGNIQNDEKAATIKKLIALTNGLYLDECISGDTEVLTEKGMVRIDKIPENNCELVETYDGNDIVFKPILKWWSRGKRDTLCVETNHGEIICTKEHLFYTKRGWAKAEDLRETDELFFVDANAKHKYEMANIDVENMSRDINWCSIRNVSNHIEENVYDIEVEDTHCFFANNILVHNCHHVAARTAKEILTASANAYWRYGGSATPYRESGDSIMIQAMFGSKIVDISASYLIKNKYLVPPYIFFEPIDSNRGLHSYKKIYSDSIVDNAELNDHIADTANHLVSRGLSTLILVQQYAQGDYLKTLIPNCEFLTGKTKSEKRKIALDELRTRKKMCMIATTLADEGLDVPTLDAALLAGGGASATRVNQRIGRTLRKDNRSINPKNKSIVVVYQHNAKHLAQHAHKVRNILKREKEFKILDSKGPHAIKCEIDHVLGIDSQQKTVLES